MTKFFTLDELWLWEYTDFIREKIMSKALNLIVWETNSWKSTTILSMLNEIYQRTKWKLKIITFENPIEKPTNFMCQFEKVENPNNEHQNFTEENFEKLAMRFDPDVILVWEVRDKDTAWLALLAARTWHITFATMHVNNTLNVIQRVSWWWLEFSDLAWALWTVEATQLFPVYKIDKNFYELEKELYQKDKYWDRIDVLWKIYENYWVFKIKYLTFLDYLKFRYFYNWIFKYKKLNDFLIEEIKKNNWKIIINKQFVKKIFDILKEKNNNELSLTIKDIIKFFNLYEIINDRYFLNRIWKVLWEEKRK